MSLSPLEIAVGRQRSVQTRRCDFEPVAPRKRILDVQQIPHFATDSHTGLDGDSRIFVDEYSDDEKVVGSSQLYIDEDSAAILHDRLYQLHQRGSERLRLAVRSPFHLT